MTQQTFTDEEINDAMASSKTEDEALAEEQQALAVQQRKDEIARSMTVEQGKGVKVDNAHAAMWLAHTTRRGGLGESTEQNFLAIIKGVELGMSPTEALESVYVINGKTALYSNAMLGLVMRSGMVSDIQETVEGEGDEMVATCSVLRANIESRFISTFTVADAKRAGLWGKKGPWTSYPQRMLKQRARAYALRDAFPDVLMGLYDYHEADEINPRRSFEPAEMNVVDEDTRAAVIESRESGEAHGESED